MKKETIYIIEYYITYEGNYFRGAYRNLEDAKKRLRRLVRNDKYSDFEIMKDGMLARGDFEGYIIVKSK